MPTACTSSLNSMRLRVDRPSRSTDQEMMMSNFRRAASFVNKVKAAMMVGQRRHERCSELATRGFPLRGHRERSAVPQ